MSDDTISNIPGAVAHTKDTAQMLVSALHDLNDALTATVKAPLQVVSGESLTSTLESVLVQYDDYSKVTVHVCDLGPVDNALHYGAFSALSKFDNARIDVRPWSSNLRDKPWGNVATLSDRFTEYELQYVKGQTPRLPVNIGEMTTKKTFIQLSSSSNIPTDEEVTARMTSLLGLESARVDAEACSGIFGSHWGGMSAQTIGSSRVLELLRAYTQDCQEQDAYWLRHPLFHLKGCAANERSLEHASMKWQLRGDGRDDMARLDTNWLAGESMVRYLAAPLMFGTVSPRRIWHMSKGGSAFFPSPLRTLVESREWHNLLAARNMQVDAAYQGQGETVYKYWRYQGFLCRYAQTDLGVNDNMNEGVLLVHGFGASGTQWNKLMHSLCDSSSEVCQGMAPDLIGFGQSEKPAISYTGYMWDSQMLDFVKEVAVHKNSWKSYVVGGNSIGGFTSLQLAACDTATIDAGEISSTGGPGSSRCSGLILMNSAGPLMSRVEIEKMARDTKNVQSLSIAQATMLKALPPCKPPSRPLARAIGGALLGYLRPRIQSICKNLYPTNPSAVDDALCGSILRDSLDPGAINVMMAGAKLPTPRTANELLLADFGGPESVDCPIKESVFTGPVLIAQGVLDPLNDATDRMNRFGSLRKGIALDPLQAGHCPHDELPIQMGRSITNWLTTTRTDRNAFVDSSRQMINQ
ncbi:hypothetical protein MPSEU_000692000 [Mayamaea pseudoterrestris]|nr:hypothetical protein MPSEU_000692000 [Mayamaea pseudoterrestris]